MPDHRKDMTENTMRTLLKALAIWVSILLMAIANGVLRESLLLPALGVPSAYLLSGLLLSAMILIVTYAAVPWLAITRPAHQPWRGGCDEGVRFRDWCPVWLIHGPHSAPGIAGSTTLRPGSRIPPAPAPGPITTVSAPPPQRNRSGCRFFRSPDGRE